MSILPTSRKLKFRILTPSLNQGKFIEQAVRSVVSQDLDGIELEYAVYDACSTDGSVDLLQQLVKEHPNIQLCIEPDRGQAHALRKGFDYHSCDIFGWVNSDDVLLPGALSAVARAFQDSNADVVYGRSYFIDSRDQVIGEYPVARFDGRLLSTFCFISQPSAFFKASSYHACGGLDVALHYAMDYSLWLKLYTNKNRFLFIDDVFSATRLHSETKTSTGGMAFAKEARGVVMRELGFVPKEWDLYLSLRKVKERTGLRSRVVAYMIAFIQQSKSVSEAILFLRWITRLLGIYSSAFFRINTRREKNLKTRSARFD